MAKITYATKQTATTQNVPEANKITAANMNEIKASVNALYDAGAEWPRYTTAGRNILFDMPQGYRIYNTDLNRPEYWNGSSWVPGAFTLIDIHCGSSPEYPAALKGTVLNVTANGKIGGTSGVNVFVGDFVIALSNNDGGTQAQNGHNWRVVRVIPQLTTLQIKAISTPIAGLQVYDTDLNQHFVYNGTAWFALSQTFFGDTAEVAAAPKVKGSFYYDTYLDQMGWSDGSTVNYL